ncbi:chloramphenicol-sensitive protein RarD [Microbacteriaceae bacterium MWH-Ta3]|nr:chloramphenicol-sensitive protein RarD [Microbacteriaceae bacterium MWH-Ta3]
MTTPSRSASGISAGIASYVLWGFLPAYFLLLPPTGPWEIVAWRIVLSLVFCLVILAVSRRIHSTFGLLRDRRNLVLTLLAGVLIYVNWQVFLVATLTGHVVESALGYFINPIVTIVLSVIFLGERLRTMQWVAIGFAGIAVVVLVVGYGAFPVYGLTLAASFGLYGLVKKKMGGRIGAVAGLTLETVWLVPIALIELVWVGATTGLTMGQNGAEHTLALALAGVVTAVPLLLFSAGTSRIPLSWMGFFQYITPTMQFIFGVYIMHEPMPAERFIGFALVWVGLAALLIDSVVYQRTRV